MKRLRVLAIDPSVMNSAGYGLVHFEWNDKGDMTKEDWAWGAWPVDGHNFQRRCHDLKDCIEADIGEFDILVGEWPMFYDSAKGQMAARQGYTINLAGILMFIAGWFHVSARRLHLYTAPTWKGTVKKAVTARRFFKLFNVEAHTVSHDAIDATMMLVYHCEQVQYTHVHGFDVEEAA